MTRPKTKDRGFEKGHQCEAVNRVVFLSFLGRVRRLDLF